MMECICLQQASEKVDRECLEVHSDLAITWLLQSNVPKRWCSEWKISQKPDFECTKWSKNTIFLLQNEICYPKVVVAGENWDAANEEAVKAGRKENTFLVHPFDQVWPKTSEMCLETWSVLKRGRRARIGFSKDFCPGNHMGGPLNPCGGGELLVQFFSNY